MHTTFEIALKCPFISYELSILKVRSARESSVRELLSLAPNLKVLILETVEDVYDLRGHSELRMVELSTFNKVKLKNVSDKKRLEVASEFGDYEIE